MSAWLSRNDSAREEEGDKRSAHTGQYLELGSKAVARIASGTQELLCLGHTRQPDYGTVLRRLAELPWIREIRETSFE